MSENSSAAAGRLIVLDAPTVPGGTQETPLLEELLSALSSPPAGGLWVEGPDGSGKTTAVVSAIRSSERIVAAKRILCVQGLRFEEVLFRLADFFRQLGLDDLHRVLHQRTNLVSKLQVLLDTVASLPVVIWLDGVHRLSEEGRPSGEDGGPSRDGKVPPLLATLLTLCSRTAASGGGLWIFTSSAPPPPEAPISTIQAGALPPRDAGILWRRIAVATGISPDETSISHLPPDLRTSPLGLRLACGLIARGAEPGSLLARGGDGSGRGEILERLLSMLSGPARELLEVLTAFRRPTGRSALRDLTGAMGDEVILGTGPVDSRLEEIEEACLVWRGDPGGSGPPHCAVHSVVADHIEATLRRDRPERWKALLTAIARYYLRLASRSGDTWHYYWSRRAFYESGHHEEASQVQKAFLQDLLQVGFHDLARRVLSQTIGTTSGLSRAVALGNLAMIHKSEMDYDRALELYTEARTELASLGDEANSARVLHQLGNTLYLKQDFDRALECYRESHRISRALDDRTVAAATRIQIANVLYSLDRKDEALRDYEATLEELDERTGATMVAAVRQQLGHLHLVEHRFVEAEECFCEAERLSRSEGDEQGVIKALRARGQVARELRDYDAAIGRLGSAEEVAWQIGDLTDVVHCRLLRGDIEVDRSQLGAALEAYLEARDALTSLRETGLLDAAVGRSLEGTVLERLARLEDRMGAEAYQRALDGRTGEAGAPGAS